MDSACMNYLDNAIQEISPLEENIIEHFKITWVIKNLLFIKGQSDAFGNLLLHSSRRMTSWHVFVYPDLEENYCVIYLHRNDTDLGPEQVFASFRFGFKINDREIWDDEVNLVYERTYVKITRLYNISDYLDSKSKTVTICWQMIVRSRIPSNRTLTKTDVYNEVFIKNILNLYRYEYLSDFLLCNGSEKLKVHKAIITSKSEYFRKKLSKSKNSLSILKSNNEEKPLWNFIKDIYTNTIIFDTREYVNISDYYYAELFQIKYLQDLLTPSEATFVTEFGKHTSSFNWEINFSTKFCDSEYRLNIGSFIFKLYLENSNADEYFALKVESKEKIKYINFSIEYTVLDADQKKHKLCETIEHEFSLQLPSFIKKSLLNIQSKSSNNRVLTVCCNVEIQNFAPEAKNTKIRGDIDKFLSVERYRKYADFSTLLQQKNYYDVTLLVQGKSVRAHKVILAAHSVHFRELFVFQKCNYIIDDLNLTGLNSLLFYIYTGKLDGNLDSAFQLFQTNSKYKVTILYQQLEEFFLSKCNLIDVCNLLLKADHYGCEDVKLMAKDFIMREFDKFCVSNYWDQLETKNTKLAHEILLDISRVYVD